MNLAIRHKVKLVYLLIGAVSLLGFFVYAPKASASGLPKVANNLGLVGYWSFEDATGTTATDFSGRGNTGTLSGANGLPVWVGGKRGKALSFDRVDDVVTVTANSSINDITTKTISLWFSNQDTSVGQTLFAKGDSSASGWQINHSASSGKIVYGHNWSGAPSSEALWEGSTVIPQNTWTHVLVTYDSSGSGNDPLIYVNGVLETITEFNTPGGTEGTDAAENLLVGTTFAKSYIDDVRLYNRGLSGSEIATLYASGAAKINASQNNFLTRGLVGLWSFDGADLVNTTAYNRSGFGNNGILTSGPTITTGKLGQALNFDGADDYVDVAAYSEAQNLWDGGGTISFWAKPRSSGENGNGYFLTQSLDQLLMANAEGVNHIGIEFAMDWSGGTARWRGSEVEFPIQKNVWGHVVITYDADSATNDPTFYYNGTSYGSLNEITAPSGTRNATTGSWQIGSNSSGTRAADTAMDDVRFYDRSLSSAEVMSLYRAGSVQINTSISTIARGLVAWHTFDGPSLNTTNSTDSSGQGNTGTLRNGPIPIFGKVGQALQFDGTDSAVNIGTDSSLDNISVKTLAAWIKPNAAAGDIAVKMLAASTADWSFYYDNTNNRLAYFHNWTGGTNGEWASATNSITVGSWHHIAVVYDREDTGNTPTFYVNGVPQSLVTIDTPAGASTDDSAGVLTIGNNPDDPGVTPFNGLIDDFRVYNRGLSATEIAQLYNATK